MDISSDRGHARPLGEFVSLQRGTTYKSGLLGQAGPVLLGLASIERNGGFRDDSLRTYGGDSPAKLILGPGDLFVSLKDVTQAGDLLGAIARVPPTVTAGRLTQDAVRLDLVDGAPDPAYLYWLLRTPQYRRYCRAHAIGTTNLSLSREDFLAFPIPPLTDERRLLVVLLESIEAKIELNRSICRTLESIARAMFKSWFVEFDPVRQKMEGGDPGLLPSLAALHPATLGTHDQGDIPSGWTLGRVGDIAEESRASVRPEQIDPDTPYIGLEHMPRCSIDLSEWGRAGDVSSGKLAFRNGDILFGKLRPYFHKVGPAPVNGVCSTDVVVVRPRNREWFGVVLGHLMSDAFVDYTTSVCGGTRMPRTKWRDMADFVIPLPPATVARAFTELIRPLVAMIQRNACENRDLAALMNALLARMVSTHSGTQNSKGVIA